MCFASLFVGVLDMNVFGLVGGDSNQMATLLIFRLPPLLAIFGTGIGMNVVGLIMQQHRRK
jgi:iron complex transport system permease protein